jgi:NAD(P)H dehydrogenase (quinone)
MNVLLVVAHPRSNSLTHEFARIFAEELAGNGHVVEVADLTAEGFDPALTPDDEPDWEDDGKSYSSAVRQEMTRIERNDATVMIYPVWWWSMPALLKGWIDRVWNYGWAYGEGHAYPNRRVWSIGLAGNDAASFAKRGYDVAMHTQICEGILRYCGVADAQHHLVYGLLDGSEAVAAAQRHVRELGASF